MLDQYLYYSEPGIELYRGDCLDVMPLLPEHSFDAIICDLPYGTTACNWDSVIPFDQMWFFIKQLSKFFDQVTLLFGSEPFSSLLRCSNLDWYKYDWKWRKSRPTSFVHAKNMPMKILEDILVFSPCSMGHAALLNEKRMRYFPQGLIKVDHVLYQKAETRAPRTTKLRPSHRNEIFQEYTNYPVNIIDVPSVGATIHPTQKPVKLMQYLIRTYTNPGDLILDFTSGSGTTLEAAKIEGRRCVGIERDTDGHGNSLGYCDYTVQRLRGERKKVLPNGTVATQGNMFAVDNSTCV